MPNAQVTATDPNWLPSTLAQATAVLVAIIGGFLVSRLVSLSSERGALVHRRSELAERLRLAQEKLDDVYLQRLAVSKKWFREHHLNHFIDQRGGVDINAALDDFIPVGSDEDEMRPYAEELAQQVRTAFDRISEEFSGYELPSGDLDHLAENLGNIPGDQAEVYKRVGAFLADTWRHNILGVPLADIPMVTDSTFVVAERERQDTRISRESDLSAEVAALNAEIQLIDEQSGRFSRPEGVTSGMVVLSFFALVGVVFPMAVMATRPVPDDLLTRRLLVGAFLVGFGALIWYLIRYVKRLRLDQDPP